MKKMLCILGIILGIISIIIAIWFYVKINIICSTKNGVLYDGFGYEYVNQEPYSPYTIWIYVSGIFGISIIGLCRDKLLKDKT